MIVHLCVVSVLLAFKYGALFMILPTAFILVNKSYGIKLTNMTVPTVADPREDMNLDCYFDMGSEELYAVKWYKDDQEFFRYMPHQQPHVMYYRVEGVNVNRIPSLMDCGETHCKVSLTNLTREYSSGAYRCEISSEAPAFRLASETHNITVAAIPRENPRIDHLQDYYSIGEILLATCTSAPADPAPILTWYINEQQAPYDYISDSTSSKPNRQGLSSRSVSIRFQLEKKHAPASRIHMKCVAAFPGIPVHPQITTQSATIRNPVNNVSNEKLFHWPGSSACHGDQIITLLLFAGALRWL